MERIHRRGVRHPLALTFALIGLELVAQILSLSMVPPLAVPGRVRLAAHTGASRVHSESRPIPVSPHQEFLEYLLGCSRAGPVFPEDDESEPSDLPQIELAVRQKASVPILILPTSPARPTGPSVDWRSSRGPASSQVLGWSMRLFRLTC